jgi:hypothetical protein
VQVLEIEELLARPPGGQRYRVRVVVGHLVEEIHRVQRRIFQRAVQRRRGQIGGID